MEESRAMPVTIHANMSGFMFCCVKQLHFSLPLFVIIVQLTNHPGLDYLPLVEGGFANGFELESSHHTGDVRGVGKLVEQGAK